MTVAKSSMLLLSAWLLLACATNSVDITAEEAAPVIMSMPEESAEPESRPEAPPEPPPEPAPKPETSEPEAWAIEPDTPTPPQPAEPPAAPERPEPPAAPEPPVAPVAPPTPAAPVAPETTVEPEPAPEPAPATAPESVPEPASDPQPAPQPKPQPAPPAASLDLEELESRLRETDAIGIFTKLELKGQVEDLVGDFEDYHAGNSELSIDTLEERFDLLVMKLLVLLQDDDPTLKQDIADARPALWAALSDPIEFESVKGP